MKGWLDDKRWADKFLPSIKQILGLYLIGEAPIEEDAERNTDLIVLKMDAVRIGCRIRRYKYFQKEKYRNEFTLRCERPHGTKTELAKIVEGWGDYFFYGFSNADETDLIAWCLCNMRVFRLWFNGYIVEHGGQVPGVLLPNADNSSKFRVFTFSDLPHNFIVAQERHRKAS